MEITVFIIIRVATGSYCEKLTSAEVAFLRMPLARQVQSDHKSISPHSDISYTRIRMECVPRRRVNLVMKAVVGLGYAGSAYPRRYPDLVGLT